MSKQDFIEVEEKLFTDNEAEVDYFEKEVGEVEIPDPETASEEFAKNNPEYVEAVKEDLYGDLDDDEEKANESFSPIKMIIQKKMEGPIKINNIIKDYAETDDVFYTRNSLYNLILKETDLPIEQVDIYSRIITNQLWYNVKYSTEVEANARKIMDSILG
jgi:hypothetical protein